MNTTPDRSGSGPRLAPLLGALVLLLLNPGCGSTNDPDLPPNLSEIAQVTAREGKSPDFSWKDGEGNTVRFEDFRGSITMVNFWATWCSPCKAELPDLIELHSKYADRGFRIIGISTDRTPNARKLVADFMKQYRIPYQIVLSNDEIEVAFGNVRMMPTTFLIDPDGNVIETFIGIRKLADFEEAITPHLL